MKRIVQTTTLDSPPAPIFRVLGHPRNVEIIWPQMLRLDRIEHLAHDRWRFQWTRELLGVRFYGLVETVAFPPDYRFLWKITGGLHVDIEWVLDATDLGTQVTLILVYAAPVPLLHKHNVQNVAEAFAADAKTMLVNLASLVTVKSSPIAG